MKLSHLYIFLLLGFLTFSCKKKTYPEDSIVNSPVFYFKGSINGAPVSFTAGESDYYMFSSYGQDSNSVYNFIGHLKKHTCDACAAGLYIQVNDIKKSSSGVPVNIDSSLTVKRYPVFANVQTQYLVKFQSSYNKSGGSYLWNFGDGQTSNLVNPSHIYARKGKYKITLQVTGQGVNSCVSTISYTSKIGYENKCETFISAIVINDSVKYSQTSTGTNPLKYLWNFGNGQTSTLANPGTVIYGVSGGRPVTLRVIDAAKDTAFATYNVVTGNDQSSCAANFKITEVSALTNPDIFGLSSSIIKWYDGNGKVYTSNNSLQPADSYFEIISIEDFDRNENNLKTKKIKVRFKCTVYSGTESLKIDNGEAVVAIAYH